MVVLQEVWRPSDDMIFHGFSKPVMKLREGRVGGGVAIAASNKAKMVKCEQFNIKGLEAVWAEVKVGRIKTIIGSVYINVGKPEEISLLDKAVEKIVKSNKKILICMDANAKNSAWDNNTENIKPYSKSKKMGDKLMEMVEKHGLFIHNNGDPTFHYDDECSALDVTLSLGMCDSYPHKWNVLDDELRSPHSAVLVTFGDEKVDEKVTVTDWNKFNWNRYEEESKIMLTELLDEWKQSDHSTDKMAKDLTKSLVNLADNISTKKVMSRHSRPWIDKLLSSMLTDLRKLRKKFQRHRSQANRTKFEEKRIEVENYMDRMKEIYKINQCKKIAETKSDKEKWRIINKLTNSDPRMSVQPIRRKVDGKEEYFFEDNDIIKEMEDYHICKDGAYTQDDLDTWIESQKVDTGDGLSIMDQSIKMHEVDKTFGTCIGAPGPDGFRGNLIDNAERDSMRNCLLFLYNSAWDNGLFLAEWKEEDRAVLPKGGKDDYHETNAYRTISLTAVLGKRFEKISSGRLLAVLEELGFDPNQFAYLLERSGVQALISLIERVQIARKEKKKVGAVFFDFTDAFGHVDRKILLSKLKNDFGIKGKLFNHLADFLKGRKARIKIGESKGEWKDSTTGSSAGTVLGPILFVIFVKDIPESINPKFADDVTALAIGDTTKEIEMICQNSIDILQDWCRKNGMKLNKIKTKVVNFSEGIKENITVWVDGHQVEVCEVMKYLGVLVDHNLVFEAQVQHAVGKARSAQNKVNILLRGRRGIPLGIAINLYKSLVRPHWEHAISAWSVLKENQLIELEKVQAASLKSMLGVFKSSSSAAVDVISNVVPVRIRINEICSREWIRIIALAKTHPLRQMLESRNPFFEGAGKGSPLGYMCHVTRDIRKNLIDKNLRVKVQEKISPESILNRIQVETLEIFPVAVGSSSNRTKAQEQLARGAFNSFYEDISPDSLLAFTDGSVLGSACVGNGGYGVVLHKKNEDPLIISGSVGRMTDNVNCELRGIIEALKLMVVKCSSDKSITKIFVFTDCRSAIDILAKQNNAHKRLRELKEVWYSLERLKALNIDLKLVWIPGHANILGNELADVAAKKGSLIQCDEETFEEVSEQVLFGWMKDRVSKRWGERWSSAGRGQDNF